MDFESFLALGILPKGGPGPSQNARKIRTKIHRKTRSILDGFFGDPELQKRLPEPSRKHPKTTTKITQFSGLFFMDFGSILGWVLGGALEVF